MRGLVVRDLAAPPSSWRATGPLEGFLVRHGVPAITSVDTHGSREGGDAGAMGPSRSGPPHDALTTAAAAAATTDGCEPRGPRPLRSARGVTLDYGIKATITRELASRFTVTVSARDVERGLHAGPRARRRSCPTGRGIPRPSPQHRLLRRRDPRRHPDLRHPRQQVLAEALGATTYKLSCGARRSAHRAGASGSGRIEITAQNHNYAVARHNCSLGDPRETTSKYEQRDVVEGLRARGARVLAGPPRPARAPHNTILFDTFAVLCAGGGMDAI